MPALKDIDINEINKPLPMKGGDEAALKHTRRKIDAVSVLLDHAMSVAPCCWTLREARDTPFAKNGDFTEENMLWNLIDEWARLKESDDKSKCQH